MTIVRFTLVLLACLFAGLVYPTLGSGAPPPGANAQCHDGSYSYSQQSHHSRTRRVTFERKRR